MQRIDQELQEIKETVLLMVSLADRNFTLAIRALVERDDSLADLVETEDSQLDHLEIIIDEAVIVFITRQRPVAQDLRFAIVASHIGRNVERFGDQAVAIARFARHLNAEPQLKPLVDIPRMAKITLEMMRDATTCFIARSADRLEEVVRRDKVVDEINRQLFRELTSYMIENPATITRCLNLLLIARCIERAADHCKGIAEEVYYLLRAIDIRHSAPGSNTASHNGEA